MGSRPRKTKPAAESPAPQLRQRRKDSSVMRDIQGALSLDLLHPSYRRTDRQSLKVACTGHCYVATEALYHLLGKEVGFRPYVFRHPNGATHWWLGHPETGEILDPTSPQLGRVFDYSQGRRATFRTAQPSKRALELMRRIAAKEGQPHQQAR
jgi:hypothetical protein